MEERKGKFGFRLKDGLDPKEFNLPVRQTEGSAGYDIYATADLTLVPNSIAVMDSYIHVDNVPDGVVGKLYMRSSMGNKNQVRLLNSVGVIDSDFRDTMLLGFHNFGGKIVDIKKGDRVAQIVFGPFIKIDDDKPLKQERTGGIGSTGK